MTGRFLGFRDSLMRVCVRASVVAGQPVNRIQQARSVMASLLIIGDRSRGRSQ